MVEDEFWLDAFSIISGRTSRVGSVFGSGDGALFGTAQDSDAVSANLVWMRNGEGCVFCSRAGKLILEPPLDLPDKRKM